MSKPIAELIGGRCKIFVMYASQLLRGEGFVISEAMWMLSHHIAPTISGIRKLFFCFADANQT